VFGDGHCMYRAVGAALNPAIHALPRNDFGVILDRGGRDMEKAAALSLRNRVADYMERSWEQFPTVLPEERGKRLEGIRGSAWGGEEELLALSAALGVEITVHQERGGAQDAFTYACVRPARNGHTRTRTRTRGEGGGEREREREMGGGRERWGGGGEKRKRAACTPCCIKLPFDISLASEPSGTCVARRPR
jgi:hypothetical protein